MTAYSYFSTAVPDPANQSIVQMGQSIRQNQEAIRDAVITGFIMGWDMTPQGSNLEQPTSIIFDKGTERLRSKNTWGSVGGELDNVTSQVFSYSSDGGSSYVSMGTYTYSYNASGVVTNITFTSA